MQLDDFTKKLIEGDPELKKSYVAYLHQQMEFNRTKLKNDLSMLKMQMVGKKVKKTERKLESF